MDELVRWLGEQLDKDEQIARAAIAAVGDVPGAGDWRFGNAYTDEGGTYWQITTMTPATDGFSPVELMGCGMSGGGAHEPEIARHAVEHDPARVLREINAKRQVLADFEESLKRSKQFQQRAKSGDETDAQKQQRHEEGVRLLVLLKVVKQLASAYLGRDGYAEAITSLG